LISSMLLVRQNIDTGGDERPPVESRYTPEDKSRFAPDDPMALLAKKKQMIFYGPPGTGKTYSAKYLIIELLSQ